MTPMAVEFSTIIIKEWSPTRDGDPLLDRRQILMAGSRAKLVPAPTHPLESRICIVTGANSGIGKETARGLARLGATVILACRNRERADEAMGEIATETRDADLAVMELDLQRQVSVREFARAFTAKYRRLDVLVNNAGIFTAKRRLTEDGVETTFAVNHLSHFLLTNLLRPLLLASAPSRIVSVASEASQMGTIDLDDLN